MTPLLFLALNIGPIWCLLCAAAYSAPQDVSQVTAWISHYLFPQYLIVPRQHTYSLIPRNQWRHSKDCSTPRVCHATLLTIRGDKILWGGSKWTTNILGWNAWQCSLPNSLKFCFVSKICLFSMLVASCNSQAIFMKRHELTRKKPSLRKWRFSLELSSEQKIVDMIQTALKVETAMITSRQLQKNMYEAHFNLVLNVQASLRRSHRGCGQ